MPAWADLTMAAIVSAIIGYIAGEVRATGRFRFSLEKFGSRISSIETKVDGLRDDMQQTDREISGFVQLAGQVARLDVKVDRMEKDLSAIAGRIRSGR